MTEYFTEWVTDSELDDGMAMSCSQLPVMRKS
jgi:hypothetical protein